MAVIIAVLLVIGYFFFPQQYQTIFSDIASQFGLTIAPQNTLTISPTLLQFSQQAEQGDFAGAIDGAQQFLDSGHTRSVLDVFQAQKLINDTNLINASTSAARFAIYQDMLQTYNDASSSPLLAAWALNDVIMQISNTGDPALVNLVAQNPALAPFVVATDTPQTISNLAKYSYTIYPNSQAAYLASTAEEDLYVHEAAVGNLSSDTSPSMQAAKNDMVAWLTKGDQLLTVEQQATSTIVLGSAYNPWEQISRGLLLGSLALADSTYVAPMHAAFQSVYNDYAGARSAILATPAASAMLLDSYFLYMLDPSDTASRAADLQKFVSVVNMNQAALQNYISWMNELKLVQQGRAAVTAAYGPQAWGPMQFSYNIYLSDAKISQPFAAFLTSQDWHVSQ